VSVAQVEPTCHSEAGLIGEESAFFHHRHSRFLAR
jgi:hypothetical protein